ncbi:hypothetical protein BLNAU_20540 [Blattamonas nauphoetae]|uniref:Uncharacterized protein n=1 Tax=Blattamonas nauphoetae TaxID=2049346 RepID=A0ABQ9WYE0_9EUKA|nr:hypothetical protein BLNAU_20540 [Blattamonas nauphoetae]
MTRHLSSLFSSSSSPPFHFLPHFPLPSAFCLASSLLCVPSSFSSQLLPSSLRLSSPHFVFLSLPNFLVPFFFLFSSSCLYSSCPSISSSLEFGSRCRRFLIHLSSFSSSCLFPSSAFCLLFHCPRRSPVPHSPLLLSFSSCPSVSLSSFSIFLVSTVFQILTLSHFLILQSQFLLSFLSSLVLPAASSPFVFLPSSVVPPLPVFPSLPFPFASSPLPLSASSLPSRVLPPPSVFVSLLPLPSFFSLLLPSSSFPLPVDVVLFLPPVASRSRVFRFLFVLPLPSSSVLSSPPFASFPPPSSFCSPLHSADVSQSTHLLELSILPIFSPILLFPFGSAPVGTVLLIDDPFRLLVASSVLLLVSLWCSDCVEQSHILV